MVENNGVDYRDDTPLSQADIDYVNKLVEKDEYSSAGQKIANWLKTKLYGKPTRGAMSLWATIIGDSTQKNHQIARDSATKVDNIGQRFDDQIAGSTNDNEMIDLRHSDMLSKSFTTARKRGDFWDDELQHRSVNADWFGAVGDGETDDTIAIQKALDSLDNGYTLIFSAGKTYKTTSLVINKSNIEVNGNGATLKVDDDGYIITWADGLSNIKVHGLKIIGNGGTKQHAIACNSNHSISNSDFYDNEISEVAVGISLNADLGGTIEDCSIHDNYIHNIHGTDTGSGYGIHVAATNRTNIYNNLIKKCERHSIYHSRGSFTKIYGNVITDHRNGVAKNIIRPALPIYRDSSFVEVYGNKFIDCFDGMIKIASDGEIGAGNCEFVDIYNNQFIRPRNAAYLLQIGSDSTDNTYTCRNIKIRDNWFQDDVDLTSNTIVLNIVRGINIELERNFFDIENIRSNKSRMIVVQTTTDNVVTNLYIVNNTFRPSGTDITGMSSIGFSGNVLTDNSFIRAENNSFISIKDNDGINYNRYVLSASATNSYINLMDSVSLPSRASMAPTNGYHEKGEIVYNTKPTSQGFIGWVCMNAGRPGIWRGFGLIDK